MAIISRRTAEHYNWGGDCDGWHLVKSPALSAIEERVPPGRSEVRHFHEKAEQFFYVLKGEATMEIEGETHRLSPGESIHVPPGRKHRLYNEEKEDLEFMVVSTPPSHGDRVEG